jgi:colicin import membrane protein
VPGIELAVVGEQGTRLPVGLVGDVVVRGEAPSLAVGYMGSGDGVPQRDGWLRFGWRGSLAADGALRLASRSPAELELVDAEAEAEERRRREEEEARELVAAAVAAAAAEAESARREAAAAEERRRAEERQREEERDRAAREAKRRAEQEAREREQAEAAARAEREAEERRGAEEEAKRRAEHDAREGEQAEAAARAEREAEERRRAEEEAKRRAEQEAREREQAEAAAQAEREAEERRRAEEEAKRRAEQEAREREHAEAAAIAEREAAVAAERLRADAAEKERKRDADGDGQVGHAAVFGPALVSEISGSSAGAVAAPGDPTYAAASTEAPTGVVKAKQGAAGPAWRHPGVRAWQLLAGVSLLVIGALLAAYLLKEPQHSTATRTVTVSTASSATLTQVPDVVNERQRSSRLAKLRAAGFEVRVYASRAKTRQVANGVIVPSVLRLEKTVAQTKLTAAGLGERIGYIASPDPAGQVVAQSPAGGVRVKRGTRVLLAVSRSR